LKFRASWRGHLRFGLVSFEVQAINAQIKEQSEIHFHLLMSLTTSASITPRCVRQGHDQRLCDILSYFPPREITNAIAGRPFAAKSEKCSSYLFAARDNKTVHHFLKPVARELTTPFSRGQP
jgi:hypothetical protein